MLKIGMTAPNFSLPDKDGKIINLTDFLGKKVVLYFYPKDNTSGCTKQALAFKENYEEFLSRGITVIGISKDSMKSHQSFISKYDLPFILLSDTSLEVLQKYGVWQEKKMYGKPYMGVVRTTFVINEEGNIEKIYEKVKPEENAKEVLCEI